MIIEKLLEAVKDSYGQRFFVVVLLTFAIVYLVINQLPVPTIIIDVWLVSLGYGLGILNEKALKTPVKTNAPSDDSVG